MIELDEKDVKQISNGRFFRKSTKFILSLCAVTLGFWILLFWAIPTKGISAWFFLIPFITLAGGLLYLERSRDKASKALLEEWKKEE